MLSIKLISIYSIFAIILGGLGYFVGTLLSPNNRTISLAGAAIGIIIGIILANYIIVQYKIEPYSWDDFVNSLKHYFVEVPVRTGQKVGRGLEKSANIVGQLGSSAWEKVRHL